MHFRIFKLISTSVFLTALECTTFVFGWGCAPDPVGGAYSTPHSLAGLKGTLLLRGRGEKQRGGDSPPNEIFWIHYWRLQYDYVTISVSVAILSQLITPSVSVLCVH